MKPSIGRIVHYVLDRGRGAGEHRPAIVVKVWPVDAPHGGAVQLQVFTDSGNPHSMTDSDGITRAFPSAYNDGLFPIEWCASVAQDEDSKKPGTWHWPERVE